MHTGDSKVYLKSVHSNNAYARKWILQKKKFLIPVNVKSNPFHLPDKFKAYRAFILQKIERRLSVLIDWLGFCSEDLSLNP